MLGNFIKKIRIFDRLVKKMLIFKTPIFLKFSTRGGVQGSQLGNVVRAYLTLNMCT